MISRLLIGIAAIILALINLGVVIDVRVFWVVVLLAGAVTIFELGAGPIRERLVR